MAKKIDKFFLIFITYFTLVAWSRFLFNSFILCLLFSAVVCLLICLAAAPLTKKVKRKPYSPDRLAQEFAIKGNNYAATVVAQALKCKAVKNKSSLVCDDVFIQCAFKFSALSVGDIASSYQKAREKKAKQLFLLCKSADRQSYSLASALDIKIEIVKIAQVFRFLQSKNALPQIEKLNLKFSLRYILQSALRRQNALLFAISGGLLCFMSYFTPLKIYYLCFGTSLLLLTILCLSPLAQVGSSNEKSIQTLDMLSQTKDDKTTNNEIENDNNNSAETNKKLDNTNKSKNYSNNNKDNK